MGDGQRLVHLDKFRQVIRAKRIANHNTATLIETSAGVLFELRQNNPKAYRKLLRKVTLALITREDIAVQPSVLKGTWQHISQKFLAVALGDPRIKARIPVGSTRGSTVGMSPINSPALSATVEGALVLVPPNSNGEAAAAVAWVVKKVESGGQLDHDLLKKLKLTEVRITAQAAANPTHYNPLLENHLGRIGASADVVLGAGALFFQVAAGASVVKTYIDKKKPGVEDNLDVGVGVAYSVLGCLSAGMETYIAVQIVRGVQKEALTVVIRRAAAAGLLASVIEGGYSIYKGREKIRSGDTDSGLWSIGSGTALVVAGAASSGAVTGSFLGIGAALGPVGWILIAVAALGLALYCAWQAFATDDENMLPVEYWLDAGVFGRGLALGKEANPYAKGAPALRFTTLQDEIHKLQEVVLVAQASFADAQGRYAALGGYQIDLPRFARGTRLEVTFQTYLNGQGANIGELVCEDGEVKPSRYRLSDRLTGMRKGPEIKIDEKIGTAHIEGMFATMNSSGGTVRNVVERIVEAVSGDEIPDALYADGLGMKLKYWPDRENMPALVSEFEYPKRKK